MNKLLKSTLGLVVSVMLLFSAAAIVFVRQSRKTIVSQVEESVQNLVKATTGKIDRLMSGVETAVKSQRWIIDDKIDSPDYMYRITRELVGSHPYIVGSTVAFAPNFYPEKGECYAPYTCQDPNGELRSFQLVYTNGYHNQSWYTECVKHRRPVWSEPYFDDGGARIMMSTYSVPIFDARSQLCAVFTADISLQQLMEYVSSIRPYKNSYVIMKAGDKVLVGEKENEAKKRGEYVGKVVDIFNRADNGWTIEIGCPIEEILREPQRVVAGTVLFSVLGLCFIFGVSWFYTKRLQRSAALRERMAGELSAARNIQAGILPKDFPSNVNAVLRPAREVGGDLYDFVKKGDKIYFIIGDASGKGVPAALFSFMAGTVFRMACTLELGPGEIVGRINAALARNNETNMFVTVFAGLFDLSTGRLDFACAGHNPPVIVSPDGQARFLDVKRKLPAGAVSGVFYEQQTVTIERGSKILAYTDGVTEAERADNGQFGKERLLEYASRSVSDSVAETTNGLFSVVDGFVDGAEQSDDITVMTIGF